ncbi:nuclear transport factor 2 family protein [Kitasatospora sp. NBC_00070]|uniref:nuclear transport factor 2 family protein n=1 Tax=Kitasatospora sp. NBC_00070 TaxID=2975962 RepID=UPI00324644C8
MAHQDELSTVRAFVAAANRGDLAGLTAALAPDVRIDMAGAVQHGRDQVLRSFFVPWVVRVSGQYRETGIAHGEDGPTVFYRFETPTGLVEDLAYTYRVRAGAVVEIVGRFA